MRIGVNLLYLLPGVVGGTEIYAAGLLAGLAGVGSVDEFIVFVNRESAEWPLPQSTRFRRVICPVQAASPSHRYAYEQIRFPFLLRRHRLDLLHSLGYVGPILAPCPAVVTVPDLNSVDLAASMPVGKRNVLRFFSIQSARRADRVITLSQFSKSRLLRVPKLPDEKISVIPLAPGLEIAPDSDPIGLDVRERYGLDGPYLVAFGGRTENKNIVRLLRAFEQVPAALARSLVLIGHLPPGVDVAAFGLRHPGRRVIATGYVPGAQAFALLKQAALFVMPSLYEGFGLPVLEAQGAGTAVACSSAGSLPEVAGEGAAYFDPKSEAGMARVIGDLLGNGKKRDALIANGKRNLERFSWKKTAQETMAVYEKVLSTRIEPPKDSIR